MKHPLGKTFLYTLIIMAIYTLLAKLALWGFIATDHAVTDLNQSFLPPSSTHWLGTDFLGRDVLSRGIHGIRIALTVGFFAAFIATSLGLIFGLLAGYFGRWVDSLVVWLYSTLESIPYILLLSAFAYSLGQGLINLFIALGLTGWVRMCRLTRAEVLKVREQEYISAAQAMGLNHLQIIKRHVLPNVMYLALIQFNLTFIYAIKIEVVLSFLGLGVEPGTPSWGLMISDAKEELFQGVWWTLTTATVLMFILILTVSLFTDHIRTTLDPRLK